MPFVLRLTARKTEGPMLSLSLALYLPYKGFVGQDDMTSPFLGWTLKQC